MTHPDLSLEEANEQYVEAVLDCIAQQAAIRVLGGKPKAEAISEATEAQRMLQESSSDPTGNAELEAESYLAPMPEGKEAQVLAIQMSLRDDIPHPHWL